MNYYLVGLLVFLGLFSPSLSLGEEQQHSIQKRQTTVSSFFPSFNSISRTLEGVSLTTIVVLAVVLLALDAVATLLLSRIITGRSSKSLSLSNWLSERVFNSIDLVDTGLNWMEIEGESCRQKAVCQAEAAAASNPVARLAINTINSNLRGLERYQDAMYAGLRGQDCDLLYSECAGPVYQGIFSNFL